MFALNRLKLEINDLLVTVLPVDIAVRNLQSPVNDLIISSVAPILLIVDYETSETNLFVKFVVWCKLYNFSLDPNGFHMKGANYSIALVQVFE